MFWTSGRIFCAWAWSGYHSITKKNSLTSGSLAPRSGGSKGKGADDFTLVGLPDAENHFSAKRVYQDAGSIPSRKRFGSHRVKEPALCNGERTITHGIGRDSSCSITAGSFG